MKLYFTIIAALFFGCSNGNLNDKDKFITNLLSEMTLMEKIGQPRITTNSINNSYMLVLRIQTKICI